MIGGLGWMEGGAETGALVAAEILGDLGLDPSPELSKLIEVKSIVPQPAFQRAGIAPMSFRTRQRVIASRAAAPQPTSQKLS